MKVITILNNSAPVSDKVALQLLTQATTKAGKYGVVQAEILLAKRFTGEKLEPTLTTWSFLGPDVVLRGHRYNVMAAVWPDYGL